MSVFGYSNHIGANESPPFATADPPPIAHPPKKASADIPPRLSADSFFWVSLHGDQLAPDVGENFLVGCLHELARPDRADFLVVRDVGVLALEVEASGSRRSAVVTRSLPVAASRTRASKEQTGILSSFTEGLGK